MPKKEVGNIPYLSTKHEERFQKVDGWKGMRTREDVRRFTPKLTQNDHVVNYPAAVSKYQISNNREYLGARTHRMSSDITGVFIGALWCDQTWYIEAPVRAVL